MRGLTRLFCLDRRVLLCFHPDGWHRGSVGGACINTTVCCMVGGPPPGTPNHIPKYTCYGLLYFKSSFVGGCERYFIFLQKVPLYSSL